MPTLEAVVESPNPQIKTWGGLYFRKTLYYRLADFLKTNLRLTRMRR
jgi:hypothetical protein